MYRNMFIDIFLKLLEEKNISIAELARSVGKTPQTVGELLKRGNLRESQMREYADKLGYDVEITLKSREKTINDDVEKQLKNIAKLMGFDADITLKETKK